ncbi:hypothetical protein SAMN05660653_03200 [Desulfonatronum thiosulfatophilum]|uniref:Uncharacterized protein n=1 Tax=Desulfonatronum thiosulfatophilum TaxID=617002 RepID=A0A1G6EVN7_9BACT|nr:hypothetical protein SAMN05660653_03200 [Desulfonatronum thiosulfatophilum]
MEKRPLLVTGEFAGRFFGCIPIRRLKNTFLQAADRKAFRQSVGMIVRDADVLVISSHNASC